LAFPRTKRGKGKVATNGLQRFAVLRKVKFYKGNRKTKKKAGVANTGQKRNAHGSDEESIKLRGRQEHIFKKGLRRKRKWEQV